MSVHKSISEYVLVYFGAVVVIFVERYSVHSSVCLILFVFYFIPIIFNYFFLALSLSLSISSPFLPLCLFYSLQYTAEMVYCVYQFSFETCRTIFFATIQLRLLCFLPHLLFFSISLLSR